MIQMGESRLAVAGNVIRRRNTLSWLIELTAVRCARYGLGVIIKLTV
jgi:hypothetical protein